MACEILTSFKITLTNRTYLQNDRLGDLLYNTTICIVHVIFMIHHIIILYVPNNNYNMHR